MTMQDFFKNEFKLLEAKTGIRQYDRILEKESWKDDLNDMIELLTKETLRPPFDKIALDVKQRVLSNAIVEDKDFIGINAKFVYRALKSWWEVNKDRYFEKAFAPREQGKIEFEPVTGEERDKWLKTWEESLKNIDQDKNKEFRSENQKVRRMVMVPSLTPEEIGIEGQEKPKREIHPKTDVHYIINHFERINEARRIILKERHPEWSDEQIEQRIKELETKK